MDTPNENAIVFGCASHHRHQADLPAFTLSWGDARKYEVMKPVVARGMNPRDRAVELASALKERHSNGDIAPLLMMGMGYDQIDKLGRMSYSEVVAELSSPRTRIVPVEYGQTLLTEGMGRDAALQRIVKRLSMLLSVSHESGIQSEKWKSGRSRRSVLRAIQFLKLGLSPLVVELATGMSIGMIRQLIAEVEATGGTVFQGRQIRSARSIVKKRIHGQSATLFLMLYVSIGENVELRVDFDALLMAYPIYQTVHRWVFNGERAYSPMEAYVLARALREEDGPVALLRCGCGGYYAMVDKQRHQPICHVCGHRVTAGSAMPRYQLDAAQCA